MSQIDGMGTNTSRRERVLKAIGARYTPVTARATNPVERQLHLVAELQIVELNKVRWYQSLWLGTQRSTTRIGANSSMDELDRWLDDYTQAYDHIPVEALAGIPGLANPAFYSDRMTYRFRMTKRLVDILIAFVLLLATLPIVLASAFLVWVTSPGPVLFKQERIGLNGKPFNLYKIRTMRHNAPSYGPLSTTAPADPRVTPVGRMLRKYRLDEIPQLWCVLRGDMSLIGPRPEIPSSHAYLTEQLPGFSLRTLVRPGITGWAQVNNGYADTLEKHQKRLEHDLYYVRRASAKVDATIAIKTIGVIVTSKGH